MRMHFLAATLGAARAGIAILLAASSAYAAPSEDSPNPEERWTLRLEGGLGALRYDGLSTPGTGSEQAGGLALEAGIVARKGRFEAGLVTGSALGIFDASVSWAGGVAGLSLPLEGDAGALGVRLEVLGEAGGERVVNIGAELFQGTDLAEATLPYLGARVGLSARAGSGRLALLLGVSFRAAWDLGSRRVVANGQPYTVGGASFAFLVRLGLELRLGRDAEHPD